MYLDYSNVAATVMTPLAEGTYTYTVTTTNSYGCSGSATVTITVLDWRCGNNLNKVTLCHNGHTICIASSAVQAHLNIGDQLGACAAPKKGQSIIPTEFVLDQNYPNPFNPTTTISYSLPERVEVSLVVIDPLGREVQRIFTGQDHDSGRHSIQFDAGELPSGIYFYRLTTPETRITRKMLLVR